MYSSNAGEKIDILPFVDDIIWLESVEAIYGGMTSGTDDVVKTLIDPNIIEQEKSYFFDAKRKL